MYLYLKDIRGNKLKVQYDQRTTVRDIKNAISKKINIISRHQIIKFFNKQLSNDQNISELGKTEKITTQAKMNYFRTMFRKCKTHVLLNSILGAHDLTLQSIPFFIDCKNNKQRYLVDNQKTTIGDYVSRYNPTLTLMNQHKN